MGKELGIKVTAYTPYYSKAKDAYEWEMCEVLSWDAAAAAFNVVMMNNNRPKLVKRLNLRFENEDKVKFEVSISTKTARRCHALIHRPAPQCVQSQARVVYVSSANQTVPFT